MTAAAATHRRPSAFVAEFVRHFSPAKPAPAKKAAPADGLRCADIEALAVILARAVHPVARHDRRPQH